MDTLELTATITLDAYAMSKITELIQAPKAVISLLNVHYTIEITRPVIEDV